MPSSVDNRVVQMTFDNEAFERKLDTTVKSIDKLEKSLKFEESKKGLQDLQGITSRFNLGDIGVHIEGASKKFLSLSTIAITTLATITSHAVKAGAQLAKSLSLELVLDGFKEYETNIGSIQTILANTASEGTTLNDVTKSLDQLNEYSDKTIYNFGQMTKNIGTFTAAGVDLDTSVQSIKGISNLAAISGSSAEQAANAMYQLSQAISTGSLKLIDWNSVVNAGMGGEVFQKALFESGKAMKTIEDADLGTTFEEWTADGNSFRSSLEKGWLTAEVLTNTLKGFTGEMTEAQLLSLGYTKAQAAEIIKLGKLGVDSATKVRTLTQLISTVKESIGSGWSQSFRIIFGDFEEATELFTNISNAIGGFVGRMSDARNGILQTWKNLGGRIILLESLQNAFSVLATVLRPIKEAFQSLFPPITGERLFDLTQQFNNLMQGIKANEEGIDRIRRTFTGIFSIFKIGIEIVKGLWQVVKALYFSFAGEGRVFNQVAAFGDLISKWREMLVEGGKIKDFFARLAEIIREPGPFIDQLKDKFFDFFNELPEKILPKLEEVKDKILGFFEDLTGFDLGGVNDNLDKLGDIPGAGLLEGVLDRINQRFEQLKGVVDALANVWDKVSARFEKIKDVLKGIFDYVIDWFKELGNKLAAEMKPGDFDAAVDAVNVGLLGGLVILFKKFLDEGLKLDFGGGFMDKISGALDQLSGTLEAMQAKLKAEALQKIAIAIGILTASLLVLSLIDSVALTKALTAMAVGFGQLVAVMAAMDKIAGLKGAAGIATTAGAMVAMSTAMLIFAGAVAIFATMSLEEIGRGLTGMAGGLALLVGAVKLIAGSGPSVILAGAAMVGIATAMVILGGALKIFATMEWKDIGKGLTAVAGLLLAIGIALALVPATAPLTAAGILITAEAMVILAAAMKIFGTMSWKEIGKGLTVMAGALLAIGLALAFIPASAILVAPALLVTAGAMVILGKALEQMGKMKGGDIAKGLGAIGGMLLILALGLTAMIVALPGAAALVVAAVGLGMMVEVVKALASIKTSELVQGLAGMAAVFVILGVAAAVLQPLIPALIGLGAAMTLIGAGFALFGAGALLTAKAIEILAKSGKKGIDAIFGFIDGFLERVPKLAAAGAMFILNFVTTILEGAAPLVKALKVLLEHIIDTVIELAPKFYKMAGEIITNILKIVREKAPEFVETGITIVLSLLKGIRDNISEIIDLGAEIIVKFLDGMNEKIPEIADAAVNLVLTLIEELSKNVVKMQAAALEFILEFVVGLAKNITKVADAAGDIIVEFVKGLGRNLVKIADAGGDVVAELIKAFGDNVSKFIKAGGDVIVNIIDGISDNLYKITDAAGDMIEELITGITDNIGDIFEKGGDAVEEFIAGISDSIEDIVEEGAKFVVKLIEGISDGSEDILDAGTAAIVKFLEGSAKRTQEVIDAASAAVLSVLRSIRIAVQRDLPEFRKEGLKLALAMIDGLTFGLAGKVARFFGNILGLLDEGKKRIDEELKRGSPSKVYMAIGEDIALGLALGIKNATPEVTDSIALMSNQTVTAFEEAMRIIPTELGNMDEFNPTITPVLDLSNIQKDSKTISSFFTTPDLEPVVSQARELSSLSLQNAVAEDITPVQPAPTEIKFEQTINAPQQLSATDIYRQTRNQLVMAKEELNIP